MLSRVLAASLRDAADPADPAAIMDADAALAAALADGPVTGRRRAAAKAVAKTRQLVKAAKDSDGSDDGASSDDAGGDSDFRLSGTESDPSDESDEDEESWNDDDGDDTVWRFSRA